MRDAFIARLLTLAQKDKRIVLITGDLGFKVFDEFISTLPRQFINAGISEQNMTTLATGLAMEGKIVFTYSIGNFPTLRCLEQIRNDAAYHNANVKVVSVGAGFSYGQLGISHHATEDISILRALPDVTLFSPGDDWEAMEATESLVTIPGTGILRLDRSSAGMTQMPGETFAAGKARMLRNGSDIGLVTTGGMLGVVLEAADELAKVGITSRVLQMHTLKPFDVDAVLEAVATTQGILSIEEHSVEGGLGGLISENILERGGRPGFFYRMGLRAGFSSVVGSQEYLRTRYGIDREAIVTTAARLLNTGMSSTAIHGRALA
jgi:transketolase